MGFRTVLDGLDEYLESVYNKLLFVNRVWWYISNKNELKRVAKISLILLMIIFFGVQGRYEGIQGKSIAICRKIIYIAKSRY